MSSRFPNGHQLSRYVCLWKVRFILQLNQSSSCPVVSKVVNSPLWKNIQGYQEQRRKRWKGHQSPDARVTFPSKFLEKWNVSNHIVENKQNLWALNWDKMKGLCKANRQVASTPAQLYVNPSSFEEKALLTTACQAKAPGCVVCSGFAQHSCRSIRGTRSAVWDSGFSRMAYTAEFSTEWPVCVLWVWGGAFLCCPG